jgi:hypothetical protein
VFLSRLTSPSTFRTAAAAISFGLVASACATTETGMLLSEEPGYARGFGDGCATAQEENKSFSTKRIQDEDQFEEDRAYRAGWRQGWLECRAQEPDRNDGGRVLGNEPDF